LLLDFETVRRSMPLDFVMPKYYGTEIHP